jgi:hypothetical protein
MDPSPGGIAYVLAAFITVVVPAAVTLILQYRSHRVLTKNHHSSKRPTIPDRLDDIEKAVSQLTEIFMVHIAECAPEKGKKKKK